MYKIIHSGESRLAIHHDPFFKYFPLSGGKLLDVGCGSGVFLCEARKLDFECYGIDFDKKSINIAKEKFCLDHVYSISLMEFIEFMQASSMRFDVITFFEVLEHQDDPRGFLQDVKKILTPGGYIAGSVPNKDRLFVDLERNATHLDYPPHHFLYFSRQSLKFLLEKEGFMDIKFYSTKRSTKRLAAALEEMLFRKIAGDTREKVKVFFSSDVNSNNKSNCINIAKNGSLKYFSMFAFLFLRVVRNIVFFPLATAIAPVYNARGYQIYFHAKLRG
ncbi:class I SAM-dependent methyltransferase [Desulfovulcanus sp.]